MTTTARGLLAPPAASPSGGVGNARAIGRSACAASAMTELTDRTLALYHVARLLKEIAHRHRVAVVVTNHVVDAPSDGAMRSAAAAGALVEARARRRHERRRGGAVA